MGRVWPGAVVEENTLAGTHIRDPQGARAGSRPAEDGFGRGYRLLGELDVQAGRHARRSWPIAFWRSRRISRLRAICPHRRPT